MEQLWHKRGARLAREMRAPNDLFPKGKNSTPNKEKLLAKTQA
jgi:hypothetical protein